MLETRGRRSARVGTGPGRDLRLSLVPYRILEMAGSSSDGWNVRGRRCRRILDARGSLAVFVVCGNRSGAGRGWAEAHWCEERVRFDRGKIEAKVELGGQFEVTSF